LPARLRHTSEQPYRRSRPVFIEWHPWQSVCPLSRS
jgi:hypothetical protein